MNQQGDTQGTRPQKEARRRVWVQAENQRKVSDFKSLVDTVWV